MKLPDWLILWVWQSLIGEISPEIRAIALQFNSERNLVLRYYFGREPDEDDIESIKCVISNIYAHTSSNKEINIIYEEVIISTVQMKDIDPLDGLIYARRECNL